GRERELRQLEEEVRVGPREVEDDGAGTLVGDDTAREVTAMRMASAGAGADDLRVVADSRRVEAEQPLERTSEVRGPQEPAVRVVDAWPQPERVGRPAVRGRGQRDGQVRDESEPVRPTRAGEGDERVVGETSELRRGSLVVERRVER